MATSSVTHNFVITTNEGVEKFVSAMEVAEKEHFPAIKVNGRRWTDAKEIALLMKKRRRNDA